MPLLPDTFNCRTRSPSQDKRCFYLAVYLSRSGVQNIGLTSAPALETELELRAFCLVSILPRPLYFNPQERFRKLAGARHDQRSRKKERQDESKRTAETEQSAGLHQKHLKLLKPCWFWSKSRKGTSVHLELDNSSKAKTCQPSG